MSRVDQCPTSFINFALCCSFGRTVPHKTQELCGWWGKENDPSEPWYEYSLVDYYYIITLFNSISLYLPYLPWLLGPPSSLPLAANERSSHESKETPRYDIHESQPIPHVYTWTQSSVSGSQCPHATSWIRSPITEIWGHLPPLPPFCESLSVISPVAARRALDHMARWTRCEDAFSIRRQAKWLLPSAQAVTRYVRGVALPDLRKYI